MVAFELTKDTPYLALSGELWSVFYEYFDRNWSCYKGFLLYSSNAEIVPKMKLKKKAVCRMKGASCVEAAPDAISDAIT